MPTKSALDFDGKPRHQGNFIGNRYELQLVMTQKAAAESFRLRLFVPCLN